MHSKSFVYSPRARDAERIDLLYFSLDRCDVGMGLARQVYFLGLPAFTSRSSECPTSCVITRPDGRVIFQFNRQFFDELGTEEIAFVTLHEALHIAFRHASRRGNRNPLLWNIACDIVINELLLAQPQFAAVTSESFRRLIDGAATMEKFEPFIRTSGEIASLSSEAIYERLAGHPGMRRFIGKVIAGLRPFHVDWDDQNRAAPNGQAAWEQEQLARRLDGFMAGAGLHRWTREQSGEYRQVQAARVPPVRWDRLLVSQVRSQLAEHSAETWIPGRRFAGLYPAVMLPSEQVRDRRDRLSVLVAIDCSGSIGHDLLNRLMTAARAIPRERVDLQAVTFDVAAYPLDLTDPQSQPRGGGGTSFVCIESYAQELPRYPDLVAVLTDGAGEPPTPRHADRWLWLLTPESTATYVAGIGRNVDITL